MLLHRDQNLHAPKQRRDEREHAETCGFRRGKPLDRRRCRDYQCPGETSCPRYARESRDGKPQEQFGSKDQGDFGNRDAGPGASNHS